MKIKDYRKELKDFIKRDVKKSVKPYQTKAKEPLKLSDDDLKRISDNKIPSFIPFRYIIPLCDESSRKERRIRKYMRLRGKL